MKKNIIGIILLLLFFSLESCYKNFDEIIPLGTASESVFWQDERHAELAVNAVYRELDGHGMVSLDAITDIAYNPGMSPGGLGEIGVGNPTTSNFAVRDYWRRYMRAIRKANDPINNIDRIPGGRAEYLNRLKAEARFLRAYYYLQVTNFWGDAPLILTPLNVGEHVGRTSKGLVVDFIIDELDDIINSNALPISYGSSDIGRATHGAALALKARVALYNGRWAVARDAAKAVMDLGVYELYPNYEELFWYAGQNSSEVIFDRQYATGYSTANLIGRAGATLGGSTAVDPLHHYVMKHERTGPENPDDPYDNLDPRFGYNVYYPGVTLPNGIIYNSWPDSPTADRIMAGEYSTSYGFNLRKWIDYENDRDNPAGSTINFIIIRYADVLLMYAESKIELNEIDQSVYDAINEVRQRPTVEMPPISTGKTQAELRDIVRRERTVELAWEGLHYFDMNRWRIGQERAGLAQGIKYIDSETGEWRIYDRGLVRRHREDRDYLWPIPQEEMEVNEFMDQNPNY